MPPCMGSLLRGAGSNVGFLPIVHCTMNVNDICAVHNILVGEGLSRNGSRPPRRARRSDADHGSGDIVRSHAPHSPRRVPIASRAMARAEPGGKAQAKPGKGDPSVGHDPGLIGGTDEWIAGRIPSQNIIAQRRGRSGRLLARDDVRAGLRGCPSGWALQDPVQRKELRQDAGFCSGPEGGGRSGPGSRSSRIRCKGFRRIRFRLSVPRLVLS
jgi:hypothetical protein